MKEERVEDKSIGPKPSQQQNRSSNAAAETENASIRPTARPAAKKAAAKPMPSVRPSAKAEPVDPQLVKTQAITPARTPNADQQARDQAARDNLQRSNTTSQASPTQRLPDDDIEAMLDREIKKEPQQTNQDQSSEPAEPRNAALALPQPPAAAPPEPEPAARPPAIREPRVSIDPTPAVHHPAPVTAEIPPEYPSADADGQPKKRRPKTEAEKAAHARYMRFSRSFDRLLDVIRNQCARMHGCRLITITVLSHLAWVNVTRHVCFLQG